MIITGLANSGQGLASDHVRSNIGEIRRLTNQNPVPGSLNLVMKEPLILDSKQAQLFDERSRFIWAASIEGMPVWVYRWSTCPLHIIEIISDFNIRKTLLIHDGDHVRVEIPCEITREPTLLEWASFFFLWKKRESWFYNHKFYHKNRLINKARHLLKDFQKFY